MISVGPIFKHLVIYPDKVSLIDYFVPSVYTSFMPFKGDATVFGMVNDKRKTIWIDLSRTEEEILMGFKSNTRNEVRKAIREGYLVEEESDLNAFVNYYNAFAKEKNLEVISIDTIRKYPNVFISKSSLNGKVLTMHASILDPDNKIVRLLYSASVRLDEGVDRKSVGLSNRLLHYKDLLEFKNRGYAIYDFGGLNEDENNEQQFNITIFKKGFGGEIRDEMHLCSIPAWLLLKLSKIKTSRK